MRKIYVFDTSTLIYDPCAWKQFPHCDIVIPIAVLSELDKLKKQTGEVGRNARVCIRLLDEIANLGDISTGILIENDTILKVDASWISPNIDMGDPTYGDTHILMCAYHLYTDHPEHDVVLVSNDINLRVKSKARGIDAIAHEGEKLALNELYSGTQIIEDAEVGLELQRSSVIDPRQYGFKLQPHECVLFTDTNGSGVALSRKVATDKLKVIKKQYPWNISARNKEQSFAIDLIMDKNIDLITLIGKAGTGKSLIVLACALELVISKKEYDKFIIYRPIQPVGNDIGFLPGPQPLTAKIMTPLGWRTMADIQPNDFVIGSDGSPKKVLKIFPKGEREVFRVFFSDGSFTECCEDHLWYTTTIQESQRKTSHGSVKSLKEIRDTLKTYKTKINNHKIPIVKPVLFDKKETIVDPYIMGVLLGDGTLSEEYSVYFTSSYDEMREHCIKKYGLFGAKSDNKFIPEDYKINNIEARLAILQGLMDTDGFVSKDGSDVSYSTTSEQLALDVQFIVQSLGGIAKINNKKSTYTYNDNAKELNSKVISISLPNDMCPFRLSRKVKKFKSRKHELHRMITDIVSVGIKETKCILVDSEDHLYTTDHFILTHNTMEEKLAPWFQAIMDNFEMLFSNKVGGDWRRDLEMFQKRGKIEMEAITYIRGRSIPNAVILIDECQNLTKEEVKTILTRAGENTKIILTGDIEQIDNSVLDATNNGLTHVIEKFKDSDLAGHITFTQGERSKLASKAAEIL